MSSVAGLFLRNQKSQSFIFEMYLKDIALTSLTTVTSNASLLLFISREFPSRTSQKVALLAAAFIYIFLWTKSLQPQQLNGPCVLLDVLNRSMTCESQCNHYPEIYAPAFPPRVPSLVSSDNLTNISTDTLV